MKINVLFNAISAHQDWYFHFPVRKDFIVPVEQQIHIPVLQGPMETCQDWLKNGSAHRVTPGCIVKEQVQCIHSSDPYQLHIFVTDTFMCKQLQFKLCINYMSLKGGLSPVDLVLQDLFVLVEPLNLHHQTVWLDSHALLDSSALQGHLYQIHVRKEPSGIWHYLNITNNLPSYL